MKTFKTFLTEYLTDEQRARYAHIQMNPDSRKATDHFFGVGNDHVREDVIGMEPEKSEVHKAVERHLGKEISIPDYTSNTIMSHSGRPIKLAKLIKDDKLRDQFANDRIRVGSKKSSSHYMTIVRGTEVAGQTNSAPNPQHPNGHSWGDESCKNVDNGSNRRYLDHEIKYGTVVVRAHDHTGQEIYRATLHPHYNHLGHTAYAVDSEYGLKHPAFTTHAHDVAHRLSGEHKGDDDYESMIYTKDDDVYNDSGKPQMLHPALKTTDLHKIMDTTIHTRIAKMAAEHHNADSALLTKALFHDNSRVQAAAAANPNASVQHIHHALDSNNFNVQLAASMNPSIKPEHIDKLIDSDARRDLIGNVVKHQSFQKHHFDRLMNSNNNTDMYYALDSRHGRAHDLDKALSRNSYMLDKKVAGHPRATPEHLDRLLEPGVDIGVAITAAGNRNASEANLLKALKHNSNDIPIVAAENQSANSNVLHTALSHENPSIRYAAISNPNAKPEHLDRALSDRSAYVASMAARHPNITSQQLHFALSHPHPNVRSTAISNPNATKEHIDRAINDEDPRVRTDAVSHPNATREHLEKALNDEEEVVRSAAKSHPRFKELIGHNYSHPDVYAQAADLYK